MDTYLHKTVVSIANLDKIEIIRNQEFMPSEGRLKFLKKIIILEPKTAILGPQFCRILVLGPHFWWSGGLGPQGPPGCAPDLYFILSTSTGLPMENYVYLSYAVAVLWAVQADFRVFNQSCTCWRRG